MPHPSDSDPGGPLRALLAAGRYREVLAAYADGPGRSPPPPPGVALSVATAATRLGALNEAEALAESALQGFRLRADDDGRMRCLNLLGAIAYERGSLDEAATRFTTSLDLSRGLSDLQSTARASNNLGSVAYLRGRVEESRSLFREALLAYQRLGDRRGMSETHHNLGIVARESGELEDAAREAERAVRHAELLDDPALVSLTMVGKAECAIADGATEVAVEDLERAEALAVRAGDAVGVAEVNRVRAWRWLRMGDPSRALATAELGREAAEESGSTQIQGECAAIAARAAQQLGRGDEATRLAAEAERLFLGLGAVLHLARLREGELLHGS